MNINQRGIDLIKSFEQLRLEAYLPTPDDVPTIGFGHVQGVKMGDVWTVKQANAALAFDLQAAEDCVNGAVQVPLTENEYASLVSLTFNIGCKAFRGSTCLRLLNESNYDGCADAMLMWKKQAGVVLPGLLRRREAERQLFEESV